MQKVVSIFPGNNSCGRDWWNVILFHPSGQPQGYGGYSGPGFGGSQGNNFVLVHLS